MNWLREVATVLRDPFATSNQEAIGFLMAAGLIVLALVLVGVLLYYVLR